MHWIPLSERSAIGYLKGVCRHLLNHQRDLSPVWADPWSPLFGDDEVQVLHRSLPEYIPTPTVTLPNLSLALGNGDVWVKDESQRFGLKAFKALGASYAVFRFIMEYCEANGRSCPPADRFFRDDSPVAPNTLTFCTATDGNHGRGVAWVARKLQQRAVIYMPHHSATARIENIRAEGAEVIVVDGDYDCAVRTAASNAERNGWQVISDTSWPGYENIPRWIMAGYTTMMREMHESSNPLPIPDVVFVQGGVGALAAAVAWYYNQPTLSARPKIVAVEPVSAACLLESIESPHGEPIQSSGRQDSIMAGLNCGTPSLVAWPLIKSGIALFLSITDDWCLRAMRTFYHPVGGDPRLVSGESGAAGLAALLAFTESKSLSSARVVLGLNRNSRVLLFNTEGDTDPAGFREIVDPN